MTERERLIELIVQCDKENDILACYNDRPNRVQAAEILTDYLLSRELIVPPCEVGDKVWWVEMVCDENGKEKLDITTGEVVSFSLQKEGLWAYCRYESGLTYWHLVADYFDKTVFLTKEKAEKELSERNKQK